MERFVAFDGGRILKPAVFVLGTLAWAAPALAQQTGSDPLAPLSTVPSAPQPAVQITVPAPIQPAQPPVQTALIPKDWRGVFDAIDAGQWASAQAGIAALPPNILTPVAKAELYTAKDSPAVDLASLQALIAEAPELPQAYQLAMMALGRGAITPPLV